MASTSGYQMLVNVGETKQIKDMAVTSLQVLFVTHNAIVSNCTCKPDGTLVKCCCWFSEKSCKFASSFGHDQNPCDITVIN